MQYVERAVEYMNRNYGRRLKIHEMADHIGVNRSYLASSFKKNVGCSPQEYLMSLRIEKTRSLLENPNMQINEAAALVGYTDPLAFSKIFKERTGKSPREYKDEKIQLVQGEKKGDCKGYI